MGITKSIIENAASDALEYIYKHNLVDYYVWLMANNPDALKRFIEYVTRENRFEIEAMFEAGVDLETVRKMAGHEDTTTTMRYEKRSSNREKRNENRS